MNEETITVDVTTLPDGKPKVAVSISKREESAMVDGEALAARAAAAYVKAVEGIQPPLQTIPGVE